MNVIVLPPAELLARYLEACAARGLAPQTLVERRCTVRHFLRWGGTRDLGAVREEEVRAYADALTARCLAPHTQAQRLWIIHDLFEWLVASRTIAANPASGICPGSSPPRIPTESEMNRILAIPNTRTAIGRRDRAILELMYATGLRGEEVSRLDVQDLDLAARMVSVRWRSKVRSVPFGEAAWAALLDYVQRTRPGFVGTPEPTTTAAALFLASDQNSRTGTRLTTYAIRALLKRIARKAGLDRPISQRQFRDACAAHMVRAGADVRHIQALFGHARIDTTEMKNLHRLYHPRERHRAASR